MCHQLQMLMKLHEQNGKHDQSAQQQDSKGRNFTILSDNFGSINKKVAQKGHLIFPH